MRWKFSAARVPKSGFGAVATEESSLAHLEMMEDMRREFTRAMNLVKHQREEMYALGRARDGDHAHPDSGLLHEIALGGLRDPVPEHLRASVVHEWELDDMEEAYVADRAAYEDDLRKAKSQVRFLERLKDDEEGERRGDLGPFECPVCVEEIDSSAAAAELAVLPCGHRLCVRCTDALVSRAPPPRLTRERRDASSVRRVGSEPRGRVNYVAKGSSRVKCVRWPAGGAGRRRHGRESRYRARTAAA